MDNLATAMALLTSYALKPSKEREAMSAERSKVIRRKAVTKSLLNKLARNGVGRNDPCPYESNKKYKKCHLIRIPDTDVSEETLLSELGLIVVEDKANEI